MSATEVASFYNGLGNKSLSDRNASKIISLRNYNNWVKAVLIQQTKEFYKGVDTKRRMTVLDLCGGKGGDMLKWLKADIEELVVVDIAEQSVKEAERRYLEYRSRLREYPAHMSTFNGHPQFGANFVHMDVTDPKEDFFAKMRRPTIRFDVVSCQFALHYAFRSEEALRTILSTVAVSLRDDRWFIGTIPDADRIMNLLRKGNGAFKNAVLAIDYLNKPPGGSFATFKPPIFGAKIHFTLDEQVNCPEFLAHLPTLERIAGEFGLELVEYVPFVEAPKKFDGSDQQLLLCKMRAVEELPLDEDRLAGVKEHLVHGNKYASEYAHAEKRRREIVSKDSAARSYPSLGTISKAEWEALSVYTTFIFKKKRVRLPDE